MTAEMLDYIMLPDRQVWTLDDLLALPDDGHRYEIFDGSLVMSAHATPLHQVVANLLAEGLRAAAPAGTSALTDVPVDLEFGGHCPVPDVVVAPSAVLRNPDVKGLTPSDVLLAVEIVSPGSISRDRVSKPNLYAKAGIPLYWRIELRGPNAPYVVLSELVDGAYREAATVTADGSVEVTRPFRFRLAPAELVGLR